MSYHVHRLSTAISTKSANVIGSRLFSSVSFGCTCCSEFSSMASFCSVHSKKMSSRAHPYPETTFKSLASAEADGNDLHLKSILDNNKNWIKKRLHQDPEFFEKLSRPQSPRFLYFGCSDSRVPSSEILGASPGEVFVHRNVGNMIPANDLNTLSVLQYAVDELGVTDIIVAGHYGCGAVKAATSRQDLGMLENWLRQIRDVYRLHKEYLDDIKDEEQRQNALVELNVIEQCLNIYKTGTVQRRQMLQRSKLLAAGINEAEITMENGVFPRIHGMVFNIKDGVLKKIPIDFKKRIGPLDHIYGLYESPSSSPLSTPSS